MPRPTNAFRRSTRPTRRQAPVRIAIPDVRVEKSATRLGREERTTELSGHALISVGLAANEGNEKRFVIRLIPDAQNGGRSGGSHAPSTRSSGLVSVPRDRAQRRSPALGGQSRVPQLSTLYFLNHAIISCHASSAASLR